MRQRQSLLIAVLAGAALLLAAAAAAAGSFITTDTGAKLEWDRPVGKPATLRVVEVKRKSEAARMGYRKGDEIIAMDDQPIRGLTFADILKLAERAQFLRVRRKGKELELPSPFKTAPPATDNPPR